VKELQASLKQSQVVLHDKGQVMCGHRRPLAFRRLTAILVPLSEDAIALGFRCKKLTHGRFRIVARAPVAVGKKALRHALDERITAHAVTASCDQARNTTLILDLWAVVGLSHFETIG
jgi:hypothetical protein